MKTVVILSCLMFLNPNTQEMTNQDCFSITKFNLLKAYLIENGSEIMLHERTIAGADTRAKEVSLDDKYVELVQHPDKDIIIVIDKHNKIPSYTCEIEGDHLEFSAYAAYFDNDQVIKTRKNDWCELVTKILTNE